MPSAVERPNIVWASIESTRFDHTSLSDYHRDTTPELERIADAPDGTSFTNCFAHGIWSRSSLGSILTCTPASRHGAGFTRQTVPESIPTVAERFADAGYTTCCISANPHLSNATNLDEGFDISKYLNKSTVLEEAGLRVLCQYFAKMYWHSGGLTTDTKKHNVDFIVNQVAKRAVKQLEKAGGPYFLFIHYVDPHHPYYPPPAFRDVFLPEVEMGTREILDLVADMSKNHHAHIANGCPFSEDEWEAIHAAYDTELFYTDRLIGELFDFIEPGGNNVFVATSDHGELFGEGGLLTHKIVTNDAVANVPLVIHGLSDVVPSEESLIQHNDVMITLLGLANADTSGCFGYDLRSEEREYAFIQRGAERMDNNIEIFKEINGDFDEEKYLSGDVTALRSPQYRFEMAGREDRLVDVETCEPVDDESLKRTFRDEVTRWLDGAGKAAATEPDDVRFDEGMKEHLRDLGYIVD